MSSATNWDGVLKRRYGKFIDPMAEVNTLAEYMGFVPREQRPGDTFEFPVQLGLEHGITFDNTRTAFTLNSAKDSVTKPARLRGSSLNLVGDIPRDMLAAMNNGASNGGDSGGSYFDGLDMKVTTLAKSGDFYREIALHYGPGPGSTALCDIGVVSTIVSGTNLGAGGPIVCDLTRASWSVGLWNNLVGGYVDIYEADGATLVESDVEVTAVDPTHNRITLSKSGVTTDVDATDKIMPRSAKGRSCVGVQGILENVGSLFEISAATYPQWRSVSYSVGGAMSRAKIMRLAARLQQNGLKDGGKLFVNGNAFADLAEEANELQRFVGNNGAEGSVTFQGQQNLSYKTPAGIIEVAVDLVQKQSLGFFIAKNTGIRVGSTDNTFSSPGSRQWFFQELEGKAGARIQLFGNQAPLLKIPYWCAELTGIASNADTTPSA